MTRAILFANLGSPDSYENKDVHRYLTEFLMDERVIDIPKFWRTILVRGIIVPFRTAGSAAKYKTIWTKEGSPLVHITREQTRLYEEMSNLPAAYCMRYGNPHPKAALDSLVKDNPDLQEVILFPFYPHYAMSSYETAVKYVQDIYAEGRYTFRLKVVPPFYNEPVYIEALANSIAPYYNDGLDQILFSYHGIPERHVQKTDCTGNHCLKTPDCCNVPSPAHAVCYRHQVTETTRLVAERLGIPKEKYMVTFQSRLGRDKWLEPFTAKTLKEMPAKGIRNVAVVCPAFTTDCLETLEEMNVEGREDFLHAGGTSFTLIPCLNTNPEWIAAMHTLIGKVN
jgi:ferrochelatase